MRIVTHNVYWFQGCPSRWGRERVAEAPEVFDALARLYASLEIDVLCLQEVQTAALAEAVARRTGMTAWLHAPGGFRPDYGGVIMTRPAARIRDLTRPPGHPPHDRVHLRASVGQTDRPLELAMVHLPSNRHAASPAAGAASRVSELARALAATPRPDVVVGDLNSRPGSPAYAFMLESGYVDAAAGEGASPARPRWTVRAGVLAGKPTVDYIWIDQAQAGRLSAFSVLEAAPFCQDMPDGTVWRLSDHPPLVADLR